MVDAQTNENESAPVGSTIEIGVAEIARMRAAALNVKRMASQAHRDAEKMVGEFDKLIRRATDSKAS